MRIQLWLQPLEKSTAVPVNYAYPLSAAIYKILQLASPEYATFLHDKGYTAPSGRLMKLFTFSKLWIPGVRLEKGMLLGKADHWKLQIGSPMHEEFVRNFVIGLFRSSKLTLVTTRVQADFLVEEVQMRRQPQFKEITRCKCLSPIVASTVHEKNGRLRPYYYRPEDDGLSPALQKNLLQKYEIIHGESTAKKQLVFRIDASATPKSKLVTLKEGSLEETRLKAFETYFTLQGSTELMQVAWECGLGEHTSQGFGMIEIVG
ncbi:CRISPR-associated endoribonuclease Cas6 [bacterium]|nr:CRISPR-associated endoribonuclease Cas6 [bacterium]